MFTSFFLNFSWFLSFILIVIGIYLGLSHTGFDFDLDKRKFRYFTSYFGVKRGKWKSLNHYSFLSLLSLGQKHTAYSTTGIPFSSSHIAYKVYLLNKKHTEKILIKKFDKKRNAEKFIQNLSVKLELDVVVYSPDFR